MTWEDLCKAPLSVITPEEVEALPRLSLEKNRYGTTFVAIDAGNMIVGLGVVHFHTGDYVKRHPGVRFVSDTYVDCAVPHCRRERFWLQKVWREDGADDARVLEKLQASRDDDNYWCNSCQGTGWRLEDISLAVKRHGTVTWADHAMALTGVALAEMLRLPTFRMPIPESILRSEAARRLEALAA